MPIINENKNLLISRIWKFSRLENSVLLSTKFLGFISLILGIILFIILAESIFYFSAGVKTYIIIPILLFLLISAFYFIKSEIRNFILAKRLKELIRSAKILGDRDDSIRDNLVNILQLLNTKNNSSEKLIEAAFNELNNKLSKVDFTKLINFSNLKKNLILFLATLCFVLLIVGFNKDFSSALFRLQNFNDNFNKPSPFILTVETGDVEIKSGNSLELIVNSEGEIPSEIFISTKTKRESEFTNHRVEPDSNNQFILKLRNVKESFTYFAYKEIIKTKTFSVNIITPPDINNLVFELAPPKYSSQPRVIQENGNIVTLLGTKVDFEFQSTKELSSAYVIFQDKVERELNLLNNQVNGSFTVKQNNSYYFKIVDKDGNLNENPILYTIKTIPDKFPSIEILKPEQFSLIPNNDIVSILYEIKDDFGFSSVSLIYSKNDLKSNSYSDFNEIKLSLSKDEIEQQLYFNWDVSQIGLRENEVISYYLEVFDNDNISGPKSGKSSVYKLRVPTLDELYTQAENVQNSAIDDLQKTLKEAEELKMELDQLENELKQNEQKIDWEEKEQIEDVMNKFEELTNKIENVQDNLKKMQQQMSEHDLLSEETMQKYNELQDLLNELNSEEMQKALAEMQKSLEQMLRDNVQKSMENFSMNEEMFKKSIERTLNLLKKIQIDQKVDEIIKRAEKLTEDINEQHNELNNSNTRDMEEAIKEQQEIGKEINSLEEEMQKLQEKMSEFSDMPQKKLDEIKEQFNEQKNGEISEETIKNIEQQEILQAMENQSQLSNNINDFKSQMQQMQQQMQQQSQQMVMQNMLKAIENIIGLSKEQEEIRETTENLKSTPKELSKLTPSQMDLMQNLDNILKQLSELSQNTFAITPEMGEALGEARSNMYESLNSLQGMNGQSTSMNQSEAMKNLNRAASLLQNSLQSMMQGGGQGGGMMSLMQQLEQMAKQQMGINKMTQMMKQGQLTMQQQAQLQRLAQQQGAVQKSLGELNQEARESGESKKIAADLEKILEEMNEVVTGLNTKKIDDELIKTQEKILSKLLDAQRSINERDFEKNRESISGQVFNLESPNQLDLEDEKTVNYLREELLKSINEGYSKDYQEVIKRYFEKLNNKELQD